MLGDDTTEQRLRLLKAEFTQHQQHGPDPTGRTATRAEAPAPIDLGVLDYMAAAAAEIDQHMRTVDTPPSGEVRPRPADPADRYEWWRDNTAHLDERRRAAREAIIYRQGLEHAIRMGDTTVIRKHPCPECGCWGLYWRENSGKAVCVNQFCVDDDGLAHTWPLAHLAQQHIARQESLRTRAT